MRKSILLLLPVFMLLSSGCVSLDPTSLVKATPAVSQFLEDYPNAEVKAVHYTIEESASIIDNVMADCEKEVVTAKEYYKVTITDEESDLDVVAWVDVKNQIVECVVKRGSTGDDDADDKDDDTTSYNECTAAQKNATACTKEYRPVCAQVDTGIRCVTTPCPSTEWKTFGNACEACATENVLGWKEGACGVVCQSKYKAKCDAGHVYWYDSCGNKEGKKEYCPLGCENGACIKDEKVCEVGKNYVEKPSCNCPDGYEMLVVYPRCEQTQATETTQATTASGGGSGSSATAATDGVTGQITGMPIAEAVKTEAGEVKIAEQYTTEASERCVGGQPLYRCVKKEQCRPQAKAACYGDHVYWYDSCGSVQEKKEYCENGCSNGECIEEEEEVCCESYGYGSQMVECCQTYEWKAEGECATPEGFVGGGKRIVDDDYCESQTVCRDTDDGYDIYEFGEAYNGEQKLGDHCNDDGTLTEKYCKSNEITASSVACPSGYVCSEGACKEAVNNTCTDSDGGYNIYEKGTANDGTRSLSDICNDDGTLTEKYCENGVVRDDKLVVCPTWYACYNGACINTLGVDLKINDADSPEPLRYTQLFTASWDSRGDISHCTGFGSWVPLDDDEGVWGIELVLPPEGEMNLNAALALAGNLSRKEYSSSLSIGIQCWDETNSTSVQDNVTVSVYQ